MAALDAERRDKAEAAVTAAAAGTLAVALVVSVVVTGGMRHFLLDVDTIMIQPQYFQIFIISYK